MESREASCRCGQLRLEVAGDPFAVSICNCLACQRRTGSAFGMQAGFKAEHVQVNGRFNDFTRISDEPDRKEHVFHFCPACGSQVFYTEPTEPDLIVVSVGSFADPTFPPPTESGYDSRRLPWVHLPDSIRKLAPELWWDSTHSLYEAGEYADAAAKGRELIEAPPTSRISCSTPHVARASQASRPRRSTTSAGRSSCGTAAARWRGTTRTSPRFASNRPSRLSSAEHS